MNERFFCKAKNEYPVDIQVSEPQSGFQKFKRLSKTMVSDTLKVSDTIVQDTKVQFKVFFPKLN